MKRVHSKNCLDEVVYVATVSRDVRQASRQNSIATRKAYELFRRNPSHPGLNFKKVEGEEDVYSARVGLGYRVLGRVDGEEIVWFWIGPHSDYDKII